MDKDFLDMISPHSFFVVKWSKYLAETGEGSIGILIAPKQMDNR